MGKGAVNQNGESFERKVSTHGMPLSEAGASYALTIKNLGGNPDEPFVIFQEVKEYFDGIISKKRKYVNERKAVQAKWESENPALAEKLHKFLANEIPEIDFESIDQKENIATRVASGNVLAHFASSVENMIVTSADLSNSDKTDGFLKKTHQFNKGDFSGAFLQAGVSELTMATIANGMALHGGVIPVCGTFFVFSDYMKPAVRLAALMKLPVKYVWTHDAFRVGEDGPTHQPVEHEAQLRLMEHLRTHSGERSMLVLRPADGPEASVAWKMALENVESPTALLLSRQGIKNLPVENGTSRYQAALGAKKGAYIVKNPVTLPDLILVANGSEVATLIEGAMRLEKELDIDVQVVSAISEGLFRDQDPAYQREVLPPNIPTIGLTAGLPVTLAGLVGSKGMVIGLESFGFSAPYTVLDEKLGYTAENIFQQAKLFLEQDRPAMIQY
jgi:transketolase